MPFGLGWPELLIILVVALLLFGGSRLAGIGKGTGRAIREFKEETRDLRDADKNKQAQQAELNATNQTVTPPAAQAPAAQAPSVVDAEVIEQPKQN